MSQTILTGLWGAWRLLLLDPRGLEPFDAGGVAAARASFLALLLLLPFELLITALFQGRFPAGWELVVFGMGYALRAVLFPLVLLGLARFWDRTALWPRAVAAYNWSMVVQMAILLPMLMLHFAGALPRHDSIHAIHLLRLVIWAYEAWVLRCALAVGFFTACSFTVLDIVLSIGLSEWLDSLLVAA
ncbi:MAG TPA: hypothetical protein VEH84_03230 [Alphaproteobacteria bacterium]|nr:hypothetical protein [Alphaproteobacteria bacterium]